MSDELKLITDVYRDHFQISETCSFVAFVPLNAQSWIHTCRCTTASKCGGNNKHRHTTLLRLNQCMARIVCTCTVSGYTSALRPILQFLITGIIIKWLRSWFQMFTLVCLYDLHILMKHQIVSIMKAWHPYNKMCCSIRAPSKRGRHTCVLLLGISHPNNHIVFGVTIGTYWVFYRMVMVWDYVDYLRGDFDYIILSVLHDSWQNKLHRK